MNCQTNTLEVINEQIDNPKTEPVYFTLCDLIETVSSMTNDEKLTAKIIAHMLNTGKVKLIGNFKGKKIIFG